MKYCYVTYTVIVIVEIQYNTQNWIMVWYYGMNWYDNITII